VLPGQNSRKQVTLTPPCHASDPQQSLKSTVVQAFLLSYHAGANCCLQLLSSFTLLLAEGQQLHTEVTH
jgi:hypothetical protein